MYKRVRLVIVIVVLLVVTVPPGSAYNPDITVNFKFYEGNPVLDHGADDAWDEDVETPRVIYQDGLFHMLYEGFKGVDQAIGYATSEDGLKWTRYEGNPVFVPDPSLFRHVVIADLLLEDDTWVIYLCARPYFGEGCDGIYRATAEDLTGTWQVESEPVLTPGGVRDWDKPTIWPGSTSNDTPFRAMSPVR